MAFHAEQRVPSSLVGLQILEVLWLFALSCVYGCNIRSPILKSAPMAQHVAGLDSGRLTGICGLTAWSWEAQETDQAVGRIHKLFCFLQHVFL